MSALGDRMKGYEAVSDYQLPRRMPLIVRVDGRAFHTFTRGMTRPFDQNFMRAMTGAAMDAAEGMQGFVLCYVQSDEASFFLQDYAKLDTEPWFGKDLSKIVSIAAAAMSVSFSLHYKRPALFDGRAFVLPDAEVANYFLWRARDWSRNSIQMLAQAHYSHRELHGKATPELHEMLHAKGVNWTTDLSDQERNGTFFCDGADSFMMNERVLPTYASVSAWLNEAVAVAIAENEPSTAPTDCKRSVSPLPPTEEPA